MSGHDLERDAALAALEERLEKNAPHVINNADLPAGSPMYYHCHTCKALVAVKPEGWYVDPPPKHCVDCDALIEQGWLDG